MKSSLKEIARLEAKVKYYVDHLLTCEEAAKAITAKYAQETSEQLAKVKRAYESKKSRKLARKAKKVSPLRQAVINSETPISEGGALPANMDLDGSLLEDENNDYIELALEGQVKDRVILNAHARLQAKKKASPKLKSSAKTSLGKHMASFNFEQSAREGLIDAGDVC